MDQMCIEIVPEVIVTHKAVVLGVFDSDIDGAGIVNVVHKVS